MKNWIIGLVAACLGLSQLSCDNRKEGEKAATAVTEALPKIAFKESGVYDFGTLTEGDTVEHTFAFTNTGSMPLIINNITASCGCTTPEWPHEPVAPGETSAIRVRFNSKNKRGEQHKTVTIYANTEPVTTELEFKALVGRPAKADSTVAP